MKNLLIFTFSPVQGFISASRRPRDLFTASFILSYLTEQVIRSLKSDLKELIYPQINESQSENLANYPNRIVAIVEDENIGSKAEKKFKEIWRNIYSSVLNELNLKNEVKEQFEKQAENYFNVFSVCIPFIDKNKWKEILSVEVEENLNADDYGYTYDLTERLLGAKKSWRPYRAQIDNYAYAIKKEGKVITLFPDGCTMCGERLHLAIDWSPENLKKVFKEGRKASRHIREGEKLCAVCLTKRFAVKYYFEAEKVFSDDLWHYPSTEEIAGIKFKKALAEKLSGENDVHKYIESLVKELEDTPYKLKKKPVDMNGYIELDAELFRKDGWEGLFKDMETILEKDKADKVKRIIVNLVNELKEKYNLEHKNPYYALLLSDGDNIGEWLGLKTTTRKEPLDYRFHKKFSEKLSEYAKEVSELWEDKYPRLTVYAGGDDLMVLLHPFDAVEYANECAKKFNEKLGDLAVEDKKASVSTGILITHAKMSLQKALIEVRKLEKKAKDVKGKGALCLGIMTRTGNLTCFVAKWDHLKLFRKLVWLFRRKKIGSGIVYEFRLLKDTFGESEDSFDENIFLSLLRRSIKRRINDNDLRKETLSLIEEFYESSKEYTDTQKELFAVNNLIDTLHVARFIGTLREVEVNEAV